MKSLDEILNQCLFFTGAGFSKPAGCKMSKEMLDDLEKKANSNIEIFTSVEKKTIKFILSCLEYQARWRSLESNGKYKYQPNIEEFALLLRRIKNRENLLPYPVTGNWSDKIMLLEQEFRKEVNKQELDLYDSIEYKIKTQCYNEWLKLNQISFLDPLKGFLKSLTNTDIKLDIFTLNNDRLLEDYFFDENSVYTGFVSQKWVGFNKENIDNDTYDSSRINYYKIHGSIDWLRLIDGTVKKSYDIKQIEDEENNIEIKPFLIFGHGTKLFTVEPFFSLLELFKKKLNEKKYYFIIGYSFFDPHINNMFFNELLNCPEQDKMIVIINPNITNALSKEDFEEKYGISDEIFLLENKKNVLIEYVTEIQKNPFYSDMPDFNIKKIPLEGFEYIRMTSEIFLGAFFKKDNGGKYVFENFISKLKEIRNNKKETFF